MFKNAVADNRFMLARRIFDIQNASRLLASSFVPDYHFDRLKVQANQINDLITNGEMLTTASTEPNLPNLMLCAPI